MTCDSCGIHPPVRSLERVDGLGEASVCGGCFARVAIFLADTQAERESLPVRTQAKLWRDRARPPLRQRYYYFRDGRK